MIVPSLNGLENLSAFPQNKFQEDIIKRKVEKLQAEKNDGINYVGLLRVKRSIKIGKCDVLLKPNIFQSKRSINRNIDI